MADINYIDNGIKYNPLTNQYIYRENSFTDVDGKFAHLKSKQDEAKKVLYSWIKISNQDDKKLITLYPMLDAHLFYDYLSNPDIKIFSDELSLMSKDIENYSNENMKFFEICSDYFNRYSFDSKNIIENGDDLSFESLVENFFEFNYELFEQYENGVSRKAS